MENKMTKYPFEEKANEFLAFRKGILSESSYKELDRRLRRINREMIMLKDKGEISTLSPAKMTADDIKAYFLYRKSRKVSASDIEHDFGTLDQLLSFNDNAAVRTCEQRNPGLKPKRDRTQRLDPLPEETYRRILAMSKEIDYGDFSQVRAYAMVLIYICTGARNKELRFCKVSDVNTADWIIHFQHVKGEDTYGMPRNVPIPEPIRPIVSEYLFHRAVFLTAHGATSDALFFKLGGDFGHLSSNSIRGIKDRVAKAVGTTFELRDCRRMFGQHYKDNHMEMEKISRLMGHKSTRTTELYYCRVSEREAIDDARDRW